MKERGLSDETIQKFGLGYSDKYSDDLYRYLRKKGYPDGLKGEDIPLEVRIISVADVYDAMTSLRSYSPPRTIKSAREEIEKAKGTQLDPEICDIMIKMIDEADS